LTSLANSAVHRPIRAPRGLGWWLAACAAGLVVLAGLSMAIGAGIGAQKVGPGELVDFLLGRSTEWSASVILSLRLPRTVLGILAGAALGLAGVVLQTAVRNPLAEPGLLGVSAGSAAAVVLAIAFGATALALQVPLAIAGALLGCSLALLVSGLRGSREDPVRLILAGAAINGLLGSVISIALLLDQSTADEMRFWTIGSLSGRDWQVALAVLPPILVGAGIAALILRPLAALSVGEDLARGLGHRPRLVRLAAMLSVALLTGSATATCGPIAFVGLVVPFAARALVGPDIRRTLPLAALLGPMVLLLADILTRVAVRPSELPLGIVMAFVGAPILIAVVRSNRTGPA